jgi:putative transposase
VRARVEHVFGDQKNAMGAEIVRTIGIVRARCKIGMTNLVYNMRRHHLRANRGRVALSGRRARLFSRKIVGWAMRDHVQAESTIAALTMAIGGAAARPDPPFRSRPPPDYRKVLGAAGMIQAMRQKGNCWDNAPMESCFGTLKTELVHQACHPTRDAARHDLLAYIEGYYNRQRLHSAIGYITPEQAERQAA